MSQDTKLSVEDRVIKVVAEAIKVNEVEVPLEASFIKDLGADSLEILSIVERIETEFGIIIEGNDLDISTVSQLVDLVKGLLEKQDDA